MAQIGGKAVAQIEWPQVRPAVISAENQMIYSGYEHSLLLEGYEAWETLQVSPSVTVTVVSGGVEFAETFTATLVATPVEVSWDLGPTNDYLSMHDPPTAVSCDGPGSREWYERSRPFLDYRKYKLHQYGGQDCLFVFWGLSEDVGHASTFTAEVVWELVLTTHWDGEVTDIGRHSEFYESDDWWVGGISTVNVIAGAKDSITTNYTWSNNEDEDEADEEGGD